MRAELGVVNAEPVIQGIIDIIINHIEVNIEPFYVSGARISGRVLIEIVPPFEELLTIPGASFISEGNFEIEWLKWLLTAGDRVVIAQYHFWGALQEPTGRTGQGIMEPRGKWQVPPEFSGTESDNWLTRALEPINSRIVAILEEEVGRFL